MITHIKYKYQILYLFIFNKLIKKRYTKIIRAPTHLIIKEKIMGSMKKVSN